MIGMDFTVGSSALESAHTVVFTNRFYLLGKPILTGAVS
jgi:hypothetical protein